MHYCWPGINRPVSMVHSLLLYYWKRVCITEHDNQVCISAQLVNSHQTLNFSCERVDSWRDTRIARVRTRPVSMVHSLLLYYWKRVCITEHDNQVCISAQLVNSHQTLNFSCERVDSWRDTRIARVRTRPVSMVHSLLLYYWKRVCITVGLGST